MIHRETALPAAAADKYKTQSFCLKQTGSVFPSLHLQLNIIYVGGGKFLELLAYILPQGEEGIDLERCFYNRSSCFTSFNSLQIKADAARLG